MTTSSPPVAPGLLIAERENILSGRRQIKRGLLAMLISLFLSGLAIGLIVVIFQHASDVEKPLFWAGLLLYLGLIPATASPLLIIDGLCKIARGMGRSTNQTLGLIALSQIPFFNYLVIIHLCRQANAMLKAQNDDAGLHRMNAQHFDDPS